MSNPDMRERMRILRELDVEAALPNFIATGNRNGFVYPARNDRGEPVDVEETCEAGLHKGRIIMGSAFTAAELKISYDWLRANGYKIPNEGKR